MEVIYIKLHNRILKNKKLIFLIIILSIILNGCSNIPIENVNITEPTNNSEYPIVVKDYLAREVTIEKSINKVACGYAYAGHVLALLGRGDDIVAVVGGLQRDRMLVDIYPHIVDLPVPFSSGSINIEELLKNKPDIAIVRSDTAKDKSEIEKLEKFNIPYITIEFNNIEEQIESIRIIAKALGESEKAEEYIDYYKKTVDYIEKTSSKIPEKEQISLYHSTNEATKTTNKDSLPVDWIRKVGIKNVAEGKELKMVDNDTYATLEQIYIWDPQVIIVNEPGVAEYILTNDKWRGLSAVKNKTVYQMPIGISRWGHHGSLEIPIAMLWTAKLIYPDYYTEIDIEKETYDFYKKFYDLDLKVEELDNLLSGKGMRGSKN